MITLLSFKIFLKFSICHFCVMYNIKRYYKDGRVSLNIRNLWKKSEFVNNDGFFLTWFFIFLLGAWQSWSILENIYFSVVKTVLLKTLKKIKINSCSLLHKWVRKFHEEIFLYLNFIGGFQWIFDLSTLYRAWPVLLYAVWINTSREDVHASSSSYFNTNEERIWLVSLQTNVSWHVFSVIWSCLWCGGK